MKKIILDLAATLDGFIEGPNGETDWCIMDNDMDFDGFLENIDTIFYGRASYDAWGNYQPQEDSGGEEIQFWKKIHAKEKVVFSHHERKDQNAVFTDNIEKTVQEIKLQQGKDIWLYGGAGLIRTFIQLNLIDVYRISVHPVALGKGKPLFEELNQRLNLKLMTTHVFRSGVVQLIYEPENIH